MPVPHESVFYDVSDLMVWPMLTDATDASPTYGARIDVPGVAAVALDPNISSNQLKGDGHVMATRSRIDDFKLTATYGKAALDVLDTLYGLDVSDVDPEHARGFLTLPQSPPTFGARFLIDDVDLGLEGIVLTVFKCKLTGGTMFGSGSDAFGQPTLEVSGTQPYHVENPDGTPFVDFTPSVMIDFWATLPDLAAIP